MTGDMGIIRGRLRPQGLVINEVQGFMSDQDRAEARRMALELICAYRDGGVGSRHHRARPTQGDDGLVVL